MGHETFTFQAEVGKLLDIVAHSLYSHKEIFLRELISNASDACDKRRYLALTKPDLGPGEGGYRIGLAVDAKAKTLSVSDNGIGMSHDDLVENLGTIARSGTQAFIETLAADKENGGAVDLIGQFGVGFYSSFMVADTVEVLTRKAGEDQAWKWSSDGKGAFAIDGAERGEPGTTVTLHLTKDAAKEYLEASRIRHIVTRYSDHIGVPITLAATEEDKEDETLNTASALWTRPAKDITADQYTEFYHHAGHAFDEPWLTLHNTVEGVISYTNLLFVPSSKPFDLFDPERKQHVKLYVNRVFITDDCEGLVPPYLRFLRGVIDSEDLSLNISREMLQKDPKLKKISSGVTKKVLGELKKKADKKPEEYATFWETFGAVLKEGLYEDFDNRDKILPLTRFAHTAGDDEIGLEAYVENMAEGQEAIYYITGADAKMLKASPQLEGFRAKGVDVLIMTDAVDEFWVPGVGKFKDLPFTSATQGGIDLSGLKGGTDDGAKETGKSDEPAADVANLIAGLKAALGERVSDVKASERLTDSACCLVSAEGAMDMHLERLLKAHQKLDALTPRVLEINPRHALIRKLAGLSGGDLDNAAFLLLDQARIVEGEPVDDPVAFAKRLSAVMEKGLA